MCSIIKQPQIKQQRSNFKESSSKHGTTVKIRNDVIFDLSPNRDATVPFVTIIEIEKGKQTEGKTLPCIFVRSLNDYIYELETLRTDVHIYETQSEVAGNIATSLSLQCSNARAGGSNQNILFDQSGRIYTVFENTTICHLFLLNSPGKRTFLVPGKGKLDETRRAALCY